MTPDAETVAALKAALADAERGNLQTVVIAGLSADGHGTVYCNMSDEALASTLDWVAEAFSEPDGEITTYAVH